MKRRQMTVSGHSLRMWMMASQKRMSDEVFLPRTDNFGTLLRTDCTKEYT